MTEEEYCDLTDLQLLRNITQTLSMVNANDDPNATRLRSIRANIYLMIENLKPNIQKYLSDNE